MGREIPELKAMAEIASVFASLEEDEVQRVLRWANEKFRGRGAGPGYSSAASSTSATVTEAAGEGDRHGFEDLPAIIDAAKPTNGLERILVAAYFHQTLKGEPDFDSQSLNSQLKHLGFPSANITRDMERLVGRSPKLIIQTRKEGTTQQARKKFRLTHEGIRAVEAMLKRSRAAVD
jgi:hypothetical protein